jgi:hypothetical protein
MSRSPTVAALALALATGRDAAECLELITAGGPCDVSAALWNDALAALRAG